MRTNLFFPVFLIFSIVLASCGGGDGEIVSQSAVAESDTLIVLQGLSEDLEIILPKELVMREGVEQGYNGNFGQLELFVGEGFEISIAEEAWSLKDEKENLENDQLFSYKYETENDSSLIFQSLLPDGAPHSYQFVLLRRINSKSFVVRTAQMSQFNHRHLVQMEKAVNSLRSNP